MGYVQEGPLTTFYAVDHGRGPRFDAWATKLLSVRTDRIAAIRRGVPGAAANAVRVMAVAVGGEDPTPVRPVRWRAAHPG